MTTLPGSENDLLALPLSQRFDLAQQLLDSVRDELLMAPLTPEQLVRVKQTLSGIDAGTVVCEPFDAVMRELRSQ